MSYPPMHWPEWIPVNERLPETDDDVLFHSKMGSYMIGGYSGKAWYEQTGMFIAGVTHWMPLPPEP
jgi:hypothetical protein